MNIAYVLTVFLAVVSLIGGTNWLFTAINSWRDGDTVPDLLQEQLKFHSNFANIVYVIVFACSLLLFGLILFPKLLEKKSS
tara:strand:+ start:948 stop:1190 length:243 start_codon:yes stop_codon:yes gene_type:complete